MRFQRELKAKNLAGVFGIDFVQRDALTEFVRDTVDVFGQQAAEIVEANPNAVVPHDKWPIARRLVRRCRWGAATPDRARRRSC